MGHFTRGKLFSIGSIEANQLWSYSAGKDISRWKLASRAPTPPIALSADAIQIQSKIQNAARPRLPGSDLLLIKAASFDFIVHHRLPFSSALPVPGQNYDRLHYCSLIPLSPPRNSSCCSYEMRIALWRHFPFELARATATVRTIQRYCVVVDFWICLSSFFIRHPSDPPLINLVRAISLSYFVSCSLFFVNSNFDRCLLFSPKFPFFLDYPIQWCSRWSAVFEESKRAPFEVFIGCESVDSQQPQTMRLYIVVGAFSGEKHRREGGC